MANATKAETAAPPQAILLVEDEPASRANLTDLLTARGYAVHGVGNGQEALDYLRCHAPPAVILLDLIMPILDGYAFRRHQRRDPALAPIPVIVLAANADEVDPEEQLGDVGFLSKPIDATDLCATLERFTVAHRPEILVVEDEPAIRRMLDVVLRHYGFRVRLASGGGEAIDLFQRHRATIDAVLLDVQMPDIDGPHTFTALRALQPSVRVVFMTGNGGQYTAEALRQRGALHVLAKPFKSIAELARLLGEVARRP